MRAALSLLAVIIVLSGPATHARGNENPEIRISEALNALVEPLKEFSGYYISVDDGALGVRGMARDPAAYLLAVQSVPIFADARLTGPEPATGPTKEERVFALTARINGSRATAGADTAHHGAASAAEISAATGGIFKSARCVHVSEHAVPPGRIMFRWRCPTDLRGVAGLVAELESALGGVDVFDFAVFESGILRESSSMDIRFSARTGPQG